MDLRLRRHHYKTVRASVDFDGRFEVDVAERRREFACTDLADAYAKLCRSSLSNNGLRLTSADEALQILFVMPVNAFIVDHKPRKFPTRTHLFVFGSPPADTKLSLGGVKEHIKDSGGLLTWILDGDFVDSEALFEPLSEYCTLRD